MVETFGKTFAAKLFGQKTKFSYSKIFLIQRIEWPSTSEDVEICQMKGKTSEQCQNYIKVIERDSQDTITICGTNAYKPKCRVYFVKVSLFAQFGFV